MEASDVSRRPRRRFGQTALIAATALLTLSVMPSAAQEALVRVDAVRTEPLRQTAPVVGRFVACRSGVVAARVAGPIGEIRVEIGDRVGEDEVLAVLVRDRFAAEVALRTARVAEAAAVIAAKTAELELRNQELRRLERLRKSPAFSEGRFADKRQEVMMTTGDLAEVQALRTRAQAELNLAEIAYRDTEVRAPYAGVVSERHTEAGAHVDPGDAVVSLIDDTCLEIEADVPYDRARALKPASTVSFDAGDGPLTAEVRAVIPDENPLTRTRAVRFTAELEDAADLAVGQSVTLLLPVGRPREIVSVHKDAVLSRNGKSVVYVVKDGAAAPRTVQLGESVGSRFEVLGGLQAGDVTVVRGNERLRPGQSVRIQAGAGG